MVWGSNSLVSSFATAYGRATLSFTLVVGTHNPRTSSRAAAGRKHPEDASTEGKGDRQPCDCEHLPVDLSIDGELFESFVEGFTDGNVESGGDNGCGEEEEKRDISENSSNA